MKTICPFILNGKSNVLKESFLPFSLTLKFISCLMCLRPIRIKNPTRYFRQGIDKEYIYVPCGHCAECTNANRMEWQIRLYYEHLGNQEFRNGFTFYFTLTYDSKHCPSVPVRDDKGRVVLCFDHTHIPGFIKRLRTQFDRDGVGISIRYFISSEYGESPDEVYVSDSGHSTYCTHRPHYHGLLFVSRNDDCILTIPQCVDYVRRVISEKWQFGAKTFTVGYDKQGMSLPAGLVGAAGPIGYCAKYIDKGLSTDKYYNDIINDERFSAFTDRIKPKHYQSQGLGRDALDLVAPATLDSGYIPCPVYDESSGAVLTRNFKLPMYLMRRLNYDFDKAHGVFVPNSHGMDVLPKIMYSQREDITKSISDFRYLFGKNFLQGSVFAEKTMSILRNTYGCNFDFDYCKSLLSVSNFTDTNIADYITFFHERSTFSLLNDHNFYSPEKHEAIFKAFGHEVSIAQLLGLGYDISDIFNMPLGRDEYYKEFRRQIRRTFIPAQVKSSREPCYVHVLTHTHHLLDDFVKLYNAFNLAIRYFNFLQRDERIQMYRQQRKVLKRALHKEKACHCVKVS